MLLADLLQRLDVVRLIRGFLESSMPGNPALPMMLQLAHGVVSQNQDAAKRKLYAMALSTVRAETGRNLAQAYRKPTASLPHA
jgi:hypothetical protein